jgi:type IV secretory pathway VirB3-like protein
MKKKELSALTDTELHDTAKKMKTASIVNAVLVGFLAGVIFYSVINNTWGLVTLLPLFLIYKLVNNTDYKKGDIEQELKRRNLK